MKRIFRLAALGGLAVTAGALMISAALAQGQTIAVGETLNLNIANEGIEGAVPVTLTIETPTVVTLLAASADTTDPVFLVRDQYGRDLITIYDNPASAAAVNPLDAALDDTLLIPGTYTIFVGRNGLGDSGNIAFSVLAGNPGIIGTGQIQIIDAAIGADERYTLPLELQEGEFVSLAAMGISPELDLRINLRSGDTVVANNDDNETFDIFLTDLDPRIYQYHVLASGTYDVTVRAFSSNLTGDFKLVVQRHGILSGEPKTDIITGETENRARNAFDVEFAAGEIVRITARSINANVDLEMDLLTPDGIFVASNDDHGTEATDLGQFDARIERVVIQNAGVYELDVNSVSGRGTFGVTIERLGVLTTADFPPVDASRAQILTPEPTLVPEVTAEATS